VQGIQAKILKMIKTLDKVAFNGELNNYLNSPLIDKSLFSNDDSVLFFCCITSSTNYVPIQIVSIYTYKILLHKCPNYN